MFHLNLVGVLGVVGVFGVVGSRLVRPMDFVGVTLPGRWGVDDERGEKVVGVVGLDLGRVDPKATEGVGVVDLGVPYTPECLRLLGVCPGVGVRVLRPPPWLDAILEDEVLRRFERLRLPVEPETENYVQCPSPISEFFSVK